MFRETEWIITENVTAQHVYTTLKTTNCLSHRPCIHKVWIVVNALLVFFQHFEMRSEVTSFFCCFLWRGKSGLFPRQGLSVFARPPSLSLFLFIPCTRVCKQTAILGYERPCSFFQYRIFCTSALITNAWDDNRSGRLGPGARTVRSSEGERLTWKNWKVKVKKGKLCWENRSEWTVEVKSSSWMKVLKNVRFAFTLMAETVGKRSQHWHHH